MEARGVVPIQFLTPGESGVVSEVSGTSAVIHRFAELGIVKGAAVRVVRSGEPCIVEVGQSRVSLRCAHQVEIFIAVESGEDGRHEVA